MTEMNEEEIIEIRMHVPEEASTGDYEVIEVSENKYMMAHNDPFSEVLTYGTIFSVLPEKKEGVFVFKEVDTESEFSIDVMFLPPFLNETELRVVGQMILDEGGYWEVLFGGMGYVNLPKSSKLNVFEEVSKLIGTKVKSKK